MVYNHDRFKVNYLENIAIIKKTISFPLNDFIQGLSCTFSQLPKMQFLTNNTPILFAILLLFTILSVTGASRSMFRTVREKCGTSIKSLFNKLFCCFEFL